MLRHFAAWRVPAGARTFPAAGHFAAFAKVFIADDSLVRLHPNLQDDYRSVWTNHTMAGAKLHVTIDGASRTPEILRIVPGSKHDVTLLGVGPWCKNALLVFDLAYY